MPWTFDSFARASRPERIPDYREDPGIYGRVGRGAEAAITETVPMLLSPLPLGKVVPKVREGLATLQEDPGAAGTWANRTFPTVNTPSEGTTSAVPAPAVPKPSTGRGKATPNAQPIVGAWEHDKSADLYRQIDPTTERMTMTPGLDASGRPEGWISQAPMSMSAPDPRSILDNGRLDMTQRLAAASKASSFNEPNQMPLKYEVGPGGGSITPAMNTQQYLDTKYGKPEAMDPRMAQAEELQKNIALQRLQAIQEAGGEAALAQRETEASQNRIIERLGEYERQLQEETDRAIEQLRTRPPSEQAMRAARQALAGKKGVTEEQLVEQARGQEIERLLNQQQIRRNQIVGVLTAGQHITSGSALKQMAPLPEGEL
jgi:hypothetical protein